MDSDARDAFDLLVADLDPSMVVVTTAAHGRRAGCLVGFTTQVSIDPRRMLVCLSERNATTRLAGTATHLAVHALASDQVGLSRLFGEETGDEVDKFEQCSWHTGPHGIPVLRECNRWFVGHIVTWYPLGDHRGALLDPVAATATGDWPGSLRYRALPPMDPGHDA